MAALDIYLAVERLRPGAAFRPTADKSAILEWRDARAQPTPAELTAAWTAYEAEQTQKTNDKTALRNAVIADLSGMVGKTWRSVAGKTQLSNTEKQQLLLGVLYRLNVIDKDTAVRPLAEWLD